MFKELILKNRSYRRFYEDQRIETGILEDLIDLARFSPSAGNLQPLKFIISNEIKKNDLIFPALGWAAYLKEWQGPEKGERPSAYIIILGDNEITGKVVWDHSIAAQSILLGAVEAGYGGCIIGSVMRDMLRKELNISERYEILLVLALGKPKETVVLEEVDDTGDIKYWRDEDRTHHVPKRSRSDLILDL